MTLPFGGKPPVSQHNHPVGEARNFVERMGDVEDGYAEDPRQVCDVGHDLGLPAGIERRQRLIEEEQSWPGEQRTPDGDALALAAGEGTRRALHQRRESERRDDVVEFDTARDPCRSTCRVSEISRDGQMREQVGFLEDIAGSAQMRRYERGPILPDLAVERDPSGGAALVAGNHPQEGSSCRSHSGRTGP